MTLRDSAWFSALGAIALLACSDDREFVPAAGSSDVTTGNPNKPARDEDSGISGRDAGTRDAAVPSTSCMGVPVLRMSPDDVANATATERPADFVVTRQAETWLPDCTTPKLILEFSDGVCPNGLGHELSISFALNSISDGVIHGGNNEVLPDADSTGLQIRYVRPRPLAPAGVWGTCTDATGQLIFLEAPEPKAGAIMQARYDLTLTPCDDDTPDMPITVVGSFKLILQYGIERFCTSRGF